MRSVSIGDSHLLLSFIIQLVPNDRVLKGFFCGMTQRPWAYQKIDSDSFDLDSDEACGQIKAVAIIPSELRAGRIKAMVNIWWSEADSDESKNEIPAFPIESASRAEAAADQRSFCGPDCIAS